MKLHGGMLTRKEISDIVQHELKLWIPSNWKMFDITEEGGIIIFIAPVEKYGPSERFHFAIGISGVSIRISFEENGLNLSSHDLLNKCYEEGITTEEITDVIKRGIYQCYKHKDI